MNVCNIYVEHTQCIHPTYMKLYASTNLHKKEIHFCEWGFNNNSLDTNFMKMALSCVSRKHVCKTTGSLLALKIEFLSFSAYMEIGTINMTAMIGTYVEPLATVTEKFGIPYFVTVPLDTVRYRPYNLLYVLPRPLDVMLVAADVARKILLEGVSCHLWYGRRYVNCNCSSKPNFCVRILINQTGSNLFTGT